MTTPARHVWLCRDTLYPEIVYMGRFKPVFMMSMGLRLWDTFKACMDELDSERAQHQYGEAVPIDTARLVDTSRNQYQCPKCGEWTELAPFGDCSCGDNGETVDIDKSRAFVVEEIRLEGE